MMDISSTDKDVHDSDVLKDVAPVLKETIPDIIRDVNEKTEVLIKNSIKMLDLWKLVYFENKKKMEKNNVVQLLRKFNEYEVFERFNIVHLILADLQKIIQIIRQLKAIRPEIQYIIIETDEKKLFFEYITKVFLQLNTELYEVDIETWKSIKDTFFKNLENRLCMNIHVAIKVSRHVVNDYKVLAFFENLLKRDKFVKQLSKEYPVICDKFINKIKHLENQFELLTTISHPMRNQPPVSGSLILVTALLLRAERDVTVFRRTTKFRPEQKNKSLLTYDKFSEKITSYKNNIFTKWLNNAIEIERRQMQEVLLDFHANKLVSKFNKELIGVIDEAIELSGLGYDLPEIIINLINRRSHIIENVIKIDALVKIYNDIINKMDAPITLAMDQHMKKIRRLLHPGLKIPGFILSLQLPKFVDDISGSIKCINMIYTEMEVLETSMFKEIQSMGNLTFFQFDNDDIQELETAFDRFKEQGNKNLTVIIHAMVVISGTLNMIENICCGTKTGRNKQMILFYEKYETAVFEALIEMVLRNVETFKKILNGDRAAFVVHGRSTDDKLAVAPNIADVTATFVGAVDDVLGRLQTVPRWLSTTNIQCPVVVDEESDFRHLYSFYDHVRDRQHVENALGECYKSIETIGNRLETTARKFQKFSFLFERRTDLMIDQFAATNPTLKDYVNQLEFFSQLSNGFRSQSYIDVGCVRFDYSEYNDKLIDRCDFWLSMYSEQLMRDCNTVMSAFTEKITTPEKFIYSRLKDAEEFDVVEHSIKEIKKMVFLADLTFNDIQNRFDLMIKHKLNIPKDCFLKYNNFKKKWMNLYEEALRKSFLIRKASKLLARSSS